MHPPHIPQNRSLTSIGELPATGLVRHARRFIRRRLAAFYCALAALTLSAGASAAPFAYITDSYDKVWVIDTASQTLVSDMRYAGGVAPMGVAVSPDGTTNYIAHFGRNRVMVTGPNGNVRVPVGTKHEDFGIAGSNPVGVAVTPDGSFVYVTNAFEHSVSVMDAANNTVVVTAIKVGSYPHGLDVSPNGRFVYVANSGGNTVSVIATANNTVVATVPVGGKPENLAVTPDSRFVYVTNSAEHTVSVIATSSNTVVGTIAVGLGPLGVDITPNGDFVYVSNSQSNTVSVIATASNTLTATISFEDSSLYGPLTQVGGVTVTPDGAFVYVGNKRGPHPYYATPNVSVIATATNTVAANILLGNPGLAIYSGAVAIFGRFICRHYPAQNQGLHLGQQPGAQALGLVPRKGGPAQNACDVPIKDKVKS